jgi:hypothetical protein
MDLAKFCFYLGIISIPLSVGLWFFAPNFSGGDFTGISDAALRAVLEAAHAERWGIFVGLWPATLLLLSLHLKKP